LNSHSLLPFALAKWKVINIYKLCDIQVIKRTN
jgi:hypothetical protein